MLLATIAMVLTVFNACTKDELKTTSDEGIAKTGKADVYLEGDYLVVKNFEAIDSLKKTLQNKSLEDQSSWENQLGLKSAKTFRAQASDKLGGFQNEADAENYAKELVKEGYFSMRDSSICYPFYNYSWDCVLNKNGVIKIGSVLYCFQKDAEVAILDGMSTTLNQFLQNSQSYDMSKVKVIPFQKLKSTTPVNYGLIQNIAQGSKYRFTLGLFWTPITQMVLNVNQQWVTAQVGNKLELYFHYETKGLFGYKDSRTIFYLKHLSANIGGNYDPIEGKYYNNWTNMTPWSYFNQLNTTTLSNVYSDVYVAIFTSYSNVYSSYPGPIINNYSCQGACDIYGTGDPVTLTIN